MSPCLPPLPSHQSLLLQQQQSSPLLVPMADKQIIPFGTNPRKPPPVDECLAIILVGEPLPLAIVPPKYVALVPPRRSYEQSYFTQVRQPALPPLQESLLLKDKPQQMKGPMIQVQKDINLLPSRPNETLMSVKTNKFGEVTCAMYTTATP